MALTELAETSRAVSGFPIGERPVFGLGTCVSRFPGSYRDVELFCRLPLQQPGLTRLVMPVAYVCISGRQRRCAVSISIPEIGVPLKIVSGRSVSRNSSSCAGAMARILPVKNHLIVFRSAITAHPLETAQRTAIRVCASIAVQNCNLPFQKGNEFPHKRKGENGHEKQELAQSHGPPITIHLSR